MLSVNNYTQEYFDQCRRRVDLQVSTYQTVVETARGHDKTRTPSLDSAIESFEHQFFNNMVLVLDYLFVHRSRALEKKDGNALNEVRVVCNSLTQNHGLMCADNSIKLDPARSILKFQFGDEIRLNESDFRLLSDAFFAELERKYM
jgi:hypothetical protein